MNLDNMVNLVFPLIGLSVLIKEFNLFGLKSTSSRHRKAIIILGLAFLVLGTINVIIKWK